MWKIWMPKTSYNRNLCYVNVMIIYMMMWFCCSVTKVGKKVEVERKK